MLLDVAVSIGLIVSFGALVTAHLTLAVGLASCPPRWRALVSLLPPMALLAPYWGAKEGLRWRTIFWAIAALSYVVCLVLAYR